MTPKPSHLYLFDLKIETSDAIKKDIAKTLWMFWKNWIEKQESSNNKTPGTNQFLVETK
jgi:hypothetical protein